MTNIYGLVWWRSSSTSLEYALLTFDHLIPIVPGPRIRIRTMILFVVVCLVGKEDRRPLSLTPVNLVWTLLIFGILRPALWYPPSFYWKAPCPRQDKRIRYDATGVRSSAHLSTVYIRLRYETLLTDTCRLSSGPMHKEWSGASPAKILYRDKNTNDVILRSLVRTLWTFALNFCDSDVVTSSLLSDRSS